MPVPLLLLGSATGVTASFWSVIRKGGFYLLQVIVGCGVAYTAWVSLHRFFSNTYKLLNAPKVSVGIGSTSAIKLEAVKRAFKHEYPYLHPTFLQYATASNINEQPFGREETILGAGNRLADLESKMNSENVQHSFLVSIENGLEEQVDSEGEKIYIDFAWIAVKDMATKKVWSTCSAGTNFPAESFSKAKKIGFTTTTVGDVLAEEYSNCSTKDPHSYLTNNSLSRADILTQALQLLLAQIRQSSIVKVDKAPSSCTIL